MSSQHTPEFAALLKRHRLLAGLSQEALADRAGLSVRGISDLERGVRRAPHLATVSRLAEALGLDEMAREGLLLAATSHAAVAEAVSTVAQETSAPTVRQHVGEERRWVTLLAVHLGGFAALAERLDPEDLHALATRCTRQIGAEIEQLDGTVVRSTGDSVLAVFGAPIAHEDDAERAVRAALAIRDCAQLTEEKLQIRAGIDTGEVLTDGIANVSGAPATIALALAAGGESTVLVSEATYRATHRHVRYREADNVGGRPAWEPLEVAHETPSRRLHGAPFVGRDHELDVVLGTLAKVLREERPHLVSVLGEAGIGKSRLIAEFERRAVASAPVRLLRGRCLPYGEVVGYRALSTALFEVAGVTSDEPAESARSKLRELVRESLNGPLGAPEVVDIERHLTLLSGLDSEAERGSNPIDERTIHVSVRRFLEALARKQPICLLIEDLHWGDEALLTLLEHVAERATSAPLLVITQARPELLEKRPSWGGGVRAFTSLAVEPLDSESSLALADALCRERGLSAADAERISRVAGGNPLFAEELCAAMAEGTEAEGVPSALRALISARLDALPLQEKRALQHAAVLGKHVWQSGLAALDVGGDVFDQLESLERRDLLRGVPVSRFGGQREYAFKHDLIQEMAYRLLPRSERRRLHARIVDWLEETAGERVEEILDLLAHHAVSAELHDRALDYLMRGAERAGRAAAHREEVALLDEALAIAEHNERLDLVPELRARRGRALSRLTLWADARRELETALESLPPFQLERRAEVLVDLAAACNWNMDAAALRQRASEALDLARTVGRQDLAMDARFWLAWAIGSEGDVATAIEQYQSAVEQTNELGVALAPTALPLCSATHFWAGQFTPAIARGREAVQIARQAGDTTSANFSLQVLGLALAASGAYDEAQELFAEALRFGREFGIGSFVARCTSVSAGYHLDVFDYEGHAAIAEEACDLARSVGFVPAETSGGIDLLLNLIRRGELGRAEQQAVDVADAVHRAGSWHGWLWALRFSQARAELALARGDLDAALTLADSAIQQARRRRPKYEVLGLLTRGAAHCGMGHTIAALPDIRKAVRIARGMGDPALFLRSASALLALDGDDALAVETSAAARQIVHRLPSNQMRDRFLAAEPVRRLGRLTRV